MLYQLSYFGGLSNVIYQDSYFGDKELMALDYSNKIRL